MLSDILSDASAQIFQLCFNDRRENYKDYLTEIDRLLQEMDRLREKLDSIPPHTES
ncbi:MAG: hypothetical protein KME10_11740 [Plectolyngbya sp. WJT66-NPBG17]|jgi:hypothetical protein|nr:hypothetical protein [Plectolyngbya sp. WJT66-NPBG17]